MTSIEVTGGPAHNRVDLEKIKRVQQLWMEFLQELQKPGEHGINNNELKQRMNAMGQAVTDLGLQVLALPAQGRHLGLKADDLSQAAEFLGRIRQPGA